MAKIFIGLAGEGRGHATRVRSYVEHLRHEHEIVVFTFDEAYEFLSRCYEDESLGVSVRRIPGLRFHYTGNRLNLFKTGRCAAGYVCRELRPLVRHLEGEIRRERPDLAITDFEPGLPRAAARCGLPWLTLDHQHFLAANDLSTLPLRLRTMAAAGRWLLRWYGHGETEAIVSSFFDRPLRRGVRNVTAVGPMLRPEVVGFEPSDGQYVLSYLRKHTPDPVLDALRGCGREVRIYGMGERPDDGNLRFRAIDERTFLVDLAGCAALIGAAGNQLLGEAIYFGKPVLALPESSHHEQLMNAHFLKEMGCGEWVALERASGDDVRAFLSEVASYNPALERYRGVWNGVPAALQAIGRHLPERVIADAIAADGQQRPLERAGVALVS